MLTRLLRTYLLPYRNLLFAVVVLQFVQTMATLFLPTLNADLLNRGMGFDAEMSRFCGRTARVKARANRCVDEKTGRMLTMKNPCIFLEDIICEGAFSANCPREFVCWWREIWLERVEPEPPRD